MWVEKTRNGCLLKRAKASSGKLLAYQKCDDDGEVIKEEEGEDIFRAANPAARSISF